MNQSDMRGLIPEGIRADRFILRRKRGPSTVVSWAGDAWAYHTGATPIAGIVPAPVEDSTVSVIKERFISPQTRPPEEGDEKKKSGFHSIGRGVRRSADSRSIAHRKPANSRATATTTLHGGLPLFSRCQYRFRNRWPARSARLTAHCG